MILLLDSLSRLSPGYSPREWGLKNRIALNADPPSLTSFYEVGGGGSAYAGRSWLLSMAR